VLVRTPLVVCPLLFVPSDLGKIDQPLRVLGPIAALCEIRPLCQERTMCEKKAKKDAPAAVVSRAACVCRAPPADASRLALSWWKTALTIALLRVAKRASTRWRGPEGRLCARIQCPWQRPQPGAPSFSAVRKTHHCAFLWTLRIRDFLKNPHGSTQYPLFRIWSIRSTQYPLFRIY